MGERRARTRLTGQQEAAMWGNCLIVSLALPADLATAGRLFLWHVCTTLAQDVHRHPESLQRITPRYDSEAEWLEMSRRGTSASGRIGSYAVGLKAILLAVGGRLTFDNAHLSQVRKSEVHNGNANSSGNGVSGSLLREAGKRTKRIGESKHVSCSRSGQTAPSRIGRKRGKLSDAPSFQGAMRL